MPLASAAAPLAGQSALITGGAKRIGRAIALTLARAGADITITYNGSQLEAQETVAAIQSEGLRAHAIQCNIRSEASVKQAVATVITQHRSLNILVNNAAIFESAPLETLTIEQWDAVFETNARGPFLVTREALQALRAAHGRIINIGSLGGLQPWADHAHYCSSKAAVHMLTKTMAKAFGPEITVNAIAPGSIDMGDISANADRAARIAARTPLARHGTAAEIAEAVLFFATCATFVTGQILAVDGGLGL